MVAEPDPLAACLAQLDRTAAWLRTLPLARFGQAGGAVERQSRMLIEQVHRCASGMCKTLATEGLGRAAAAADCPPPGATPDTLGVHALGDQLAVHAADLNRCGRAYLSAGLSLDADELSAVATAALRLRAAG